MLPKFLRPEVLPYASVVVIPAEATICAWCPDWRPTVNSHGASHSICAACAVKLEGSAK